MDVMTDPSEYDWVDDDDLDLAQTLDRLNRLQPAAVVTSRAPHVFAAPADTQATAAAYVTTITSHTDREAVTFA